jgi:hypothetical protein
MAPVAQGDFVLIHVPLSAQVDARNIYTLEDPLPAIDRLLLGRAGSVVELGLQRPGAGAVRRVRVRRNAGYFTVDRPSAAEGAGGSGGGLSAGGDGLAPRVRVRKVVASGGSSRHVAAARLGGAGPGAEFGSGRGKGGAGYFERHLHGNGGTVSTDSTPEVNAQTRRAVHLFFLSAECEC